MWVTNDVPMTVLNYFLQNPNHTELAWILNCLTPIGKLKRMTTWKVGFCSFALSLA